MNEMQKFLVEDHIHGLEREAARIRAERERDDQVVESSRTPAAATTTRATALPAGAEVAATPVMIEDGRSTRIRLGRWLVGIGAAIAGTTGDGLADDRIVAGSALTATTTTAVKAAHGPCDDGPSTLSHAA